jgi:cyclophilin family peptidyl-prolyl cis-trans isomerase
MIAGIAGAWEKRQQQQAERVQIEEREKRKATAEQRLASLPQVPPRVAVTEIEIGRLCDDAMSPGTLPIDIVARCADAHLGVARAAIESKNITVASAAVARAVREGAADAETDNLRRSVEKLEAQIPPKPRKPKPWTWRKMLKALWWWFVPDVDVIPDAEDTRDRLTRLYRHQVAELYTSRGVIVIRFYPDAAREHVFAFTRLAVGRYYEGTTFDHVIEGSRVEAGDLETLVDPSKRNLRTDAEPVARESNAIAHVRGVVAAIDPVDTDKPFARFFIVTGGTTSLDRSHCVFGRVIKGMRTVDAIANSPRDDQGRPRDPVVLQKIVITDRPK